jgi:GH18 family chitinase
MKKVWKKLDLRGISRNIDYWHVATYDFNTPALNDSSFTAPNSPLHRPKDLSRSLSWNINQTIRGYLSAGVSSTKLLTGVPLFGHAWYLPSVSGSKWQNFGIKASRRGSCCGPYKRSYGAGYGSISRQCGTFMYSEIVSMDPPVRVYYDKVTQTAIGFMKYKSNDGLVSKGTWFTFNNKNSIEALTNFIAYYQLGGAFVYDLSQDSFNSSGKFTFDLTNTMYEGLQGEASGFICNPMVGCNVCTKCCRLYLTNQFDCDACTAIRCPHPSN